MIQLSAKSKSCILPITCQGTKQEHTFITSNHVHEKELLPELNPDFSPHIVPWFWCTFCTTVDPQRVHHVEPVVELCRSLMQALKTWGNNTYLESTWTRLQFEQSKPKHLPQHFMSKLLTCLTLFSLTSISGCIYLYSKD